MEIRLKKAMRGTVFEYAGLRWRILEHSPGGTSLCLSEDILESIAFDANNRNNWGKSTSFEYMNGPLLEMLRARVKGNDAFLAASIDLTTDDGLKDYGSVAATLFLLTAAQYRRNRDIIAPIGKKWWLSTALSTDKGGYARATRLVNADGTISNHGAADTSYGLRVACYLKTDLLIESIEPDVTAAQAGKITAEIVKQYGGSYGNEAQFRTMIAFAIGQLKESRELDGEEASG